MREEKEDEAEEKQEEEDEDEWVPPTRPPAAAKGKRRASTIGLEPAAAEAPMPSSRSTRARGASVSPAPEDPQPVAVQPGPSTSRPALREIQSPPPSMSTAPVTATKPAKRAVVEQLQPRQPRKTSTAPSASTKSATDVAEKEDGRGAALLKAKKDAVRNQRAKQAEEEQERSEAQDGANDEEEAEDRSGSVAEETVSGPRSRKAPKKVEELEVLSEEGASESLSFFLAFTIVCADNSLDRPATERAGRRAGCRWSSRSQVGQLCVAEAQYVRRTQLLASPLWY